MLLSKCPRLLGMFGLIVGVGFFEVPAYSEMRASLQLIVCRQGQTPEAVAEVLNKDLIPPGELLKLVKVGDQVIVVGMQVDGCKSEISQPSMTYNDQVYWGCVTVYSNCTIEDYNSKKNWELRAEAASLEDQEQEPKDKSSHHQHHRKAKRVSKNLDAVGNS